MTPNEHIRGLSSGAFLALDYLSEPEHFASFMAWLEGKAGEPIDHWTIEIIEAMRDAFRELLHVSTAAMQ